MSGLPHAISQITDELSADECKRVWYLCGDLHMDSFSEDPRGFLKSVLCRKDCMFLMELILKIKRYDLLREVLSTNKSTVEGMLKNQHAVPEYRVLMSDVSEDMGTEDLKSLTFLLRGTLPKHKLDNVQNFLDIVVELEKLEELSSEKMDLLEHCLMTIHRTDLARKIKHFQQTVYMSKQESPVAERLQICRKTLLNISSGISSVCCNVRQMYKHCDKQAALESEPACSNSCRQEEVYSIHTDPRGLCLILDCVGTEADDLEQTFRALCFHVVVHRLLSVHELESTLRRASLQLSDISVFVCCVISRSHSSILLATDSQGPGLSLEALRSRFSPEHCPGLTGKPKLFFIQSYEESEPLSAAAGLDEGELETDVPKRTALPVDADVFWSHCSTEAQELKKTQHRSVYLQALRSSLSLGYQRRSHLLDMHTVVNRAVDEHNRQSDTGSQYSLNLRHTLRKDLYFS